MADGSAKPPSDQASVLRQVGAMAGVGFEFLFTVLMPGAFGYWLDKRFGTSPWLILIGGAIGFAVGLYRLLKTSAAVMR